jgi:Protein of unknown function (DUF4197)
MKKVITLVILCSAVLFVHAQTDTAKPKKSFLQKANEALGGVKSGSGAGSLTNDEIVAGLKEALSQGATKSADKLSLADGFFKDAAIKILMPQEIKNVETKLRSLGMGKLVDNAILSMNRAAEDASKKAAPIFIDAVKKMTVTDALNILRGADTAATGYLRKTTSATLSSAFKPVIDSSLQKVNATKYWKDVFTTYNKFSLKPVNTDLNEYVTGKALDGLFYYVASEEKNIRANPAARVNDILKKVFGAKK